MKKWIIIALLITTLTSCFTLTRLELPEDAIMAPDTENNWSVGHYVDKYGIETDKAFIQTFFLGTFSNSATNNSDCYGFFRVNDEGAVEIVIYEYGSYRADGYGSDDRYYLTMWDSNTGDLLVTERGYLSDRFSFYPGTSSQNIINALATSTNVRVRVSGGKYSSSTYNFSFDASGFAAKCLQIMDGKNN